MHLIGRQTRQDPGPCGVLFCWGQGGGCSNKLDEPHAPIFCELGRPTPPAQPPQRYPYRVVGPGERDGQGFCVNEPHAPMFFRVAKGIRTLKRDAGVIILDKDPRAPYLHKIETDKLSELGYAHLKTDLYGLMHPRLRAADKKRADHP